MTPTAEQIAEVQRTFPAWDEWTVRRHLQQRAAIVAQTGRAPRFLATYCSQCGGSLGPGDEGASDCRQHWSKQ